MKQIINIEERIIEIKKKLKQEGYADILINYKELQYLHQKYMPEIEEKVFAIEILGLSQGNYMKIKNKGTRGRILKKDNKTENVKSKEEHDKNQEAIENCKNKLKQECYEEKLIKYEELQQMHKKYLPEIEEKDFAIQVLGLTYANYSKMKNKGQRGKILKKDSNISTDKVDEIKRKLKQEGYEGKLIKYEELQQLHKKYIPEIEEKIFAIEILGFTYDHYLNVKNKGKKGKIRDKNIVIKSKYIENTYLTESRYYTKEEIEEICEANNLTIEEFIKYVVLNFNTGKLEEAIEQYKKAINKYNQLWIGKIPLSNDLYEKYINIIYERAQRVTYKFKTVYKYNTYDAEDYIQELSMYILQNCGDIEKNFGEEEEFFEKIIYNKMKYYLLLKIFTDKNITLRKTSTTKRYVESESGYEGIYENEIKADVNIEDDFNEESEDMFIGEKSINRLKELVSEGHDKKRALNIVQEELNLSKAELISIITTYLERNKTVNLSDEGR